MRILSIPMFLYCLGYHRHLPSFPTRRSSDLGDIGIRLVAGDVGDQQDLDDLAAGGGAELDLHVVPLVGVQDLPLALAASGGGHPVLVDGLELGQAAAVGEAQVEGDAGRSPGDRKST